MCLWLYVKDSAYEKVGERAFKQFLQKIGLRNEKILRHDMSKALAPRLSVTGGYIGTTQSLIEDMKEMAANMDNYNDNDDNYKSPFDRVAPRKKGAKGRNRTKSLLVIAQSVLSKQREDKAKANEMATIYSNMTENEKINILNETMKDLD